MDNQTRPGRPRVWPSKPSSRRMKTEWGHSASGVMAGFNASLRQALYGGGNRRVIFVATAERSIWPFDAIEPEARSNRVSALIVKARCCTRGRAIFSSTIRGYLSLRAFTTRDQQTAPADRLPRCERHFHHHHQGHRGRFSTASLFRCPVNRRMRQESKPPTAPRASRQHWHAKILGEALPQTATLRPSLTFLLSMDVFPSMAASRFCRLTRAFAHEPAVR